MSCLCLSSSIECEQLMMWRRFATPDSQSKKKWWPAGRLARYFARRSHLSGMTSLLAYGTSTGRPRRAGGRSFGRSLQTWVLRLFGGGGGGDATVHVGYRLFQDSATEKVREMDLKCEPFYLHAYPTFERTGLSRKHTDRRSYFSW